MLRKVLAGFSQILATNSEPQTYITNFQETEDRRAELPRHLRLAMHPGENCITRLFSRFGGPGSKLKPDC